MACQAASWIPNAVATILRSDSTAQPIIAWLTTIRDSTEEYDPLITVKPESADSEDSDSSTTTPDSAFDEILSQLGKEIFKLEEYQKNFGPGEQEVSLSILNIFDECLERFENGTVECVEVKEVGATEVTDSEQDKVNSDCVENSVVTETNGDKNSVAIVNDVKENGVNVNGDQYSDCESTLSEVSFVTSTPAKCDKVNINEIFYQGEGTPVPPRRTRLKTPSSSSSCYENMELKTKTTNNEVAKRLDSESDSESTCWSYKECSDAEDAKDRYAMVWSHSSGFHNSDEILRRVLSLNHAAISRLSFDTASDFTPTQYSVYALHEVGDRCEPVATMTPGKPDDGYEPVRDALTTDENIYEEIEYGYSYTDEGCSCGGSVEVESCSVSASSEGVGRDSPLYANLRDHDAYAVTPDVIYWKNLLLDPYYNEDEEDEWISPEESVVYTREVRPPLVIPRITQYRAPRREQRFNAATYEDYEPKPVSGKSSVRQYERHHDWSPSSERSRLEVERGFSKANSDSPPFQRIHKKMSGSSENLLVARRPNHLQLPASSSGDSLDVEVRETPGNRTKMKSRSMVTAKRGLRSPVPTPRALPDITVVHEGPVKRTKFFENGKKSRKNWVECYMVLTQTGLYFYKDYRTYNATKIPKPPGTPPSPTAPRPEMMLGLQNAHVIQCIQTHTRRYARSLELTINHDRYLLQDETEEGAKRWLMYIQSVIYRLGPPSLNENLTPHYQSSNTDLESLGRTPPVSRHFRNKPKAGGSSNEDLSDSTEASTQKSHVKSRLRKFFAKRPPMEVLVKKGIYKDEPVFGKNLAQVCVPDPAHPGAPLVPAFVKACISEIESSEENMCTDGLYRASGNLSQVQKIRLEIDQNNLSVIEYNTDIHVLTGSLKLFFRELKEPLIPCSMFDRILAACSIRPREAKIKEFRDIIQSLPQCNRDTLKYLLEHLLRVTQYSERNRMHTANLAIVFGPTLLWAPAEQAHNIAIDCIQQNNVVDILLTEFKEIFEDNNKSRRKS